MRAKKIIFYGPALGGEDYSSYLCLRVNEENPYRPSKRIDNRYNNIEERRYRMPSRGT